MANLHNTREKYHAANLTRLVYGPFAIDNDQNNKAKDICIREFGLWRSIPILCVSLRYSDQVPHVGTHHVLVSPFNGVRILITYTRVLVEGKRGAN